MYWIYEAIEFFFSQHHSHLIFYIEPSSKIKKYKISIKFLVQYNYIGITILFY